MAVGARTKNDVLATSFAVLLMVSVAATMVTYETIPSIQGVLGALIAALTLCLTVLTALLRPVKTAPLLGMFSAILLLTLILHSTVAPQQFDILLRYITALAALFVFHLAPIPDLRRVFAYFGMVVIGYAAYIALTGGEFEYAGTIRITPVRASIAASAIMVSALTVLIALAPLKRVTKIVWVGVGLVLIAGYGVVTPAIMVAVFFAGWHFLRKGWNRAWLYGFAAVAVIAGIMFRNDNSVRGANVQSLGVGAVGSGRLEAWIDRFQDFAERDPWTKLSGLGPYSDYQVSGLWLWEEKSAHSDLVTLLMEFGVIGLVLVIVAVRGLYKRANEVEKLAIIAIAFGAAASNSLLDRPVEAVGWGIAFYACRYHSVVRLPKKTRRRRVSSYDRHLQLAMRNKQPI